MICLKAYTEWKDLFDENVSSVWQNESITVLKKLSMLLFSIKNEIKKIGDEVDSEVLNLKRKVIEAPKKLDILLEDQSRVASDNNKENIQLKNTEISISQPKRLSADITADSPEMFKNVEVPPLSSNDSSSIIISDDDDTISPVTNESPEIKRKKRNHPSQKRSHRWQKLRDSNTSAMSSLRGLNSRLNEVAGNDAKQSSQEIVEKREPINIMDDMSSMDFLKGLVSSTTVADSIKINAKSGLTNKEQDLVITPVKSDIDIDLSIVQCTPVQVSLPKRKDKSSYLSYLSKKKCKREKALEQSDQTTLTQIFSKKTTTKKCVEKGSRLQTTNYDSDETYFTPGSQVNKTASVMGITRMVSYLNTDSLSGQYDTREKIPSQGITNLDPDTEQIAKFVEDIRFEDFEDQTSLNSAIVEDVEKDEEEEEENLPQGLNEFLAKAQNVPQHQLAPEPVVRGNARKQLPGWSCKDCEKFYVNQGLNSEQILALNKCSKHRGYYRPREDTLPGFWDMNLVTQETKNTK